MIYSVLFFRDGEISNRDKGLFILVDYLVYLGHQWIMLLFGVSFYELAGLKSNDVVLCALPIYHGNGTIIGTGSASII